MLEAVHLSKSYNGTAALKDLNLQIEPVVYSDFDDVREWSPSKLLARLRRRATQPGAASF